MILLVINGYFLLGSVPLLILKHDTSLDAGFVRGFVNTYYLAAMCAASLTATSYAFADKWVFAAGAAGLALLATILRRTLLPKMDSLQAQIQVCDANSIREFRRLHVAVILINLAQLALIVWTLIVLSMQMK